MLTRQFKIELCRPSGACIVGDSLLHRGKPLRCFMSPLRGLRLINDLGQLVYHYQKISPTESRGKGVFGWIVFVCNHYSIRPRCNCSMGNIKSRFLPHTILPSSILNCRNLRSSRYLLYCGCGYCRMKAPISTICEVLSLKVRCTERLPASDALVIYKQEACGIR